MLIFQPQGEISDQPKEGGEAIDDVLHLLVSSFLKQFTEIGD